MPYFIVLLPFLAVFGVIGAMLSLVRGRRRSALALWLVGLGSAGLAIAMYYTSI